MKALRDGRAVNWALVAEHREGKRSTAKFIDSILLSIPFPGSSSFSTSVWFNVIVFLSEVFVAVLPLNVFQLLLIFQLLDSFELLLWPPCCASLH